MNTPASKALVLTIRTPHNNANPIEALIEEDGGTLGRAPANTVPLPGDQNIALVHATIEPIGERWILKDIGDLIPIMRNGRPLGFGQKCEIGEGDEIDIGIFQITVSQDMTRAARILAQRAEAARAQQMASAQPIPAIPVAAQAAFAGQGVAAPKPMPAIVPPSPMPSPMAAAPEAVGAAPVIPPSPFDSLFQATSPAAPAVDAPAPAPAPAPFFQEPPRPAPAPTPTFSEAPRAKPAPAPEPSDDLLSLLADPFAGGSQAAARNFMGNDDLLLDGVLPAEPSRERSDLTNPMHMQTNLDPLRHRSESIDSLFGLDAGTGVDPLASGSVLGGANPLTGGYADPLATPGSADDPIMSVLNQHLGSDASQRTQRDMRTDLNTSVNLPNVKPER